jgi:hypothetical protein
MNENTRTEAEIKDDQLNDTFYDTLHFEELFKIKRLNIIHSSAIAILQDQQELV